MKILILSLLLASCATPKPPAPTFEYKSVQERIMDCYKLLKRLGENGKLAGDFCNRIYKED